MSRPTTDKERPAEHSEAKTGIHLVMAAVVSLFDVMLILLTCLLSWEMWTIPLILIGLFMVWTFHIVKIISGNSYEYLCIGLILVEFFYYGAHAASLFGLPVIVCLLLYLLSMLDKKFFLHLLAAMYLLALLYQCFVLHTIRLDMPAVDFMHLGLGVVGTVCAMLLSRYVINKRKEESMQAHELMVQLEEAKQRNADFLSNISHELRTPINMVTGISEVALARKLSTEVQGEMQSIQLAGKRLAGEINDILDYTEIVGNTLVSVNDQYMFSSVLSDVITMISVQHRTCKLEMVFDMDVNIPYVLVGDGEKLCRVLKILLDNAIKFTEEGGIYVRVGFRREEYGINLNIDICDTGVGMSASHLSHVCEDFYQVDSSRSRNAGGLGLGLPIARGLLCAMGGFFYIDSKEDRGTQVHISIPQGIADDRPSMAVQNPEKLCIVGYFKADKYSRREVRQYYDNLIYHLAVGLGVEGHRVYHLEELENLLLTHKPTHLFIEWEEYEENASYFEKMAKSFCVALIASESFCLPVDSSLILIHKPFSPLPLVNLLNGVTHKGIPVGELMDDQSFSCDGVRALVVDDEEMNLVVARGILSNYGMQVDTCPGGEAAVEQCMNIEYDVIFLDHMMPGIDGVETLKRIRKIKDGLYQELPIIALTANAISGAREMFKSEGFTEFVPKPIERPVLERALRRALPIHLIHYDDSDKTHTKPSEQLESDGQAEPIELTEQTTPVKPTGRTESTEQAVELDNSIDRLRQGGFNVEAGLAYCSGSEEFYIEMLKMFYMQSQDKRKEIIALYDAKNWGDYAIKAHALKSTSRTIGAELLSEQAKSLEQAGKDGDVAYIQKHHPALLQLYESNCELIAASLGIEDDRKGEDEA